MDYLLHWISVIGRLFANVYRVMRNWVRLKPLMTGTGELPEVAREAPPGLDEFAAGSTWKGATLSAAFTPNDLGEKTLCDDPRLFRLQQAVLRRLLKEIGQWYIPRRVCHSLRKHDAFTTLKLFLSMLGLSYNALSSVKHQNVLFGEYLQLLLEVDQLCSETGLNDELMYKALATQGKDKARAVDQQLEHYRSAKVLFDLVEKDKAGSGDVTDFDGYKRLRERISEGFVTGEILRPDVLTQCLDGVKQWRLRKTRFNQLEDKFLRIAAELRKIELGAKMRKTVKRLGNDFEGLRQKAAKAGRYAEVDSLSKRLDRVLASLWAVVEAVLAGDAGESDDEAPSPEQAQHAACLGLTGVGRLCRDKVIEYYRRAVSRWHPDRNPDNKAEAEARTKAIHKAKDYFIGKFERNEEVVV